MKKSSHANSVVSDLRAEIARQQLTLYKLAAEVNVHPGRLGLMLKGKTPMAAEVAQRIASVLDKTSEHPNA